MTLSRSQFLRKILHYLHSHYLPTYLLTRILTFLLNYLLTHSHTHLAEYIHANLSLFLQHYYILLRFIIMNIIYYNITELLLILLSDCKSVNGCKIKKSWRFSSIMVEKIKGSRNLKNYVIIEFSSLKKYTSEFSRPPPLLPLMLSLQNHRQSLIKVSKSPPILHSTGTKSCCRGAIEMDI